ncbi:MAG TPA: hypothetical protein VK824_09505, partial [Planctomycetota bacterium]|nr:hypothetical protein [Planctomycetota bacterium]
MSASSEQPAGGPASGSLSAKDQATLAVAAELFAPLKRTARVSHFNGTLFSIGGALSLMFALMGTISW